MKSFFPDKNLRFLVIDDSAEMRSILVKMLKDLGYRNTIFSVDGEDASHKLTAAATSNEKFGCIICDWNMPQMSGIELLRVLRADEHYKTIPFIMITAEIRKENIIEALEAKVSEYIVKPFSLETLEAKLKKVLSKPKTNL